MRQRLFSLIVPVIGAFAFGAVVAGMAAGQPGGGAGGGGGVRSQSAPGPQHEALAKLAGEYTTVSKLILSEGADPFESEGTAKVSAILEGRFIVIEESGDTLGVPFKCQRFLGYNGSAGKYEAVTMFTSSTAMTTLSGKSADGGKSVRLEGGFEDEDGKTKYTVEVAFADAATFRIVQISMNADGSPGAKVETTYTRK